MAKKFGSTSRNETIKSGSITAHMKSETYKGEDRYKFVVKLPINDREYMLVNIPVDSDGRMFAYSGKGDNEGKTYARVFATHLKEKR